MKKIIAALVLSVFVVANAFSQELKYVEGTEADFMSRIRTFVEQTKVSCDNYAEDEWSFSIKEFDKFDDEYDEIHDRLSSDDQVEYKRLRGAYAGLVAHNGPKIIGTKAKKIYKENIQPFLEGVFESIKD